jgi:lipopolysaccharide export system protein LptA
MMKPFYGRCRCTGLASVLSLLLFLFMILMPSQSWSAEKQKAKTPREPGVIKSDSPLHIASDRMEVSQTEKFIFFEGHVVVQQDDMTITGNRMKVFAAADKKDEKKDPQVSMMDRVDRIEVEGDVKISQKDKVATADKSVYYHQERKIILIGNPVVSQGQDSVRGRVITLYLAEGRSVVEGGDAPVHAILHPARKE